MINNILIYALLAAGGYWYYTQNKYKEEKIIELKTEIKNQRKYFDDKVKKVEFNIKSVMKKKEIESGIKYDKHKSVSLDSKRIYY